MAAYLQKALGARRVEDARVDFFGMQAGAGGPMGRGVQRGNAPILRVGQGHGVGDKAGADARVVMGMMGVIAVVRCGRSAVGGRGVGRR